MYPSKKKMDGGSIVRNSSYIVKNTLDNIFECRGSGVWFHQLGLSEAEAIAKMNRVCTNHNNHSFQPFLHVDGLPEYEVSPNK